MSDHLSDEQLASLRVALLEQKTRLLARGGIEVDGDDDAEPMDLQERAAGEVAQRDRLALGGLDRRRLGEVEAALGRMAAGSYGECEESGDPIPFARLRAEPTCRYTVESQEVVESERARARVVAKSPDDVGY